MVAAVMIRDPLATTLPSGEPADNVAIRLRLIGQMEAWNRKGESVLPPGRKTRALLAIVVLSSPRPVLRSRLAELLWSRRPEEQARASLRQEIHRLLEVLAAAGQDVLYISRDSLSLRPGTVWVDVDEVLRATTANPGSLALLDGELLEELNDVDPAFDAWLHSERERLRDRARSVAEALLNEQVAPEALIPVAQQLLAIDRAHEGAWRALMRAHAERGERGMAIQSYDRCRAVLADMLDAVPSPETQALLAEIRSGKTVRPPSAPPLPAPEPRMEPRGAKGITGPRLGVLPLTLVGTEETEGQVALGLAEEITSALARFRWLFLVSSSSIAQLVQGGRDDTALRQSLGLDYVLDGSVQRAGSRLRITLRLIDLRDSSKVLWNQRFDRQVDDLLTLQDEIAAEVVAQIDPVILNAEGRRASLRAVKDLSAYELMARAVPGLARLARAEFLDAGEMLRRSIEREPDYAQARAWYAYWTTLLWDHGWAEDHDAATAEASKHAERAITLQPQSARSFAIIGHVRASLQHRTQEAISLHERALTLNPCLGMAWALSGFAWLYNGDPEEGQDRLDRYKQLSPADPFGLFFDVGFSLVALIRRDFEAAANLGRLMVEINPSFCAACKPYLAALGHLGQTDEAAIVKRRILMAEPHFNLHDFVTTSPFRRPQDTETFAEGLRLAGIPEA